MMVAPSPVPSPMVRRVAAAQATLDRFRDQPFEWGRNDCARMAAFHLKQFGYRPPLAKAGAYSTALSARRALLRTGQADLAAVIDAMGLARIVPAAALAGDVLLLPSADDLGALVVAMGNGRVLGWHPDAPGAVVMAPADEAVTGWSVL